MEKTWENFWMTGRVEDYLSYRNSALDKDSEDNRDDDKKKEREGTQGAWDSR